MCNLAHALRSDGVRIPIHLDRLENGYAKKRKNFPNTCNRQHAPGCAGFWERLWSAKLAYLPNDVEQQ
jgi:hypothetical protein